MISAPAFLVSAYASCSVTLKSWMESVEMLTRNYQ